MDYIGRQERLAASLKAQGVDGLLVTHMPNVRYLSGFTGSAGVFAAVRNAAGLTCTLFTDGRYTQQAAEEVRRAKVVIAKGAALPEAAKWICRRAKRLGFDAQNMPVAVWQGLKAAVRPGTRLVATREVVEGLRMVKEAGELAQMRAAASLASSVFEEVVGSIKAGVPENRVAAELEYMCRRLGAEGMSFDTLVSSGMRSALPHGVASSSPIPAKGFVILDFGVILGGYCSDMTRTVHVGIVDKQSRRVYEAVKEAQAAGLEAVRPGVKTSEVDRAARKVLEKARLAKYFTHSTGHGVGLEIHEGPGLRRAPKGKSRSQKPGNDIKLEAGMVVTIEPGAYIPGLGGVRIEDMVAVTARGHEVLTPTRKELILL